MSQTPAYKFLRRQGFVPSALGEDVAAVLIDTLGGTDQISDRQVRDTNWRGLDEVLFFFTATLSNWMPDTLLRLVVFSQMRHLRLEITGEDLRGVELRFTRAASIVNDPAVPLDDIRAAIERLIDSATTTQKNDATPIF